MQREREQSRQLHDQLVRMQQDQHGKIKEKSAVVRSKNRKVTELERSPKRQATMLTAKTSENNNLRAELQAVQRKLSEREKVWQQNKDLVTKNCGQAANIDRLKRQTEALQRKVEDLQSSQANKTGNLEENVPRVYKAHLQR